MKQLLISSAKVTELNLKQDRHDIDMADGWMDGLPKILSINGRITIDFQSSGDFGQFIKKDGTLKRKKLSKAIGIAILNQNIEL